MTHEEPETQRIFTGLPQAKTVRMMTNLFGAVLRITPCNLFDSFRGYGIIRRELAPQTQKHYPLRQPSGRDAGAILSAILTKHKIPLTLALASME
jgi:hypothetical protein